MGTLNMLGLAKRIGARFLLTSTSEVYGDPLEHPQKETYWGNVNPIGNMLVRIFLLIVLVRCLFISVLSWNHLGVRSCYDEGKRTAETLTMDYHRGAEVEVTVSNSESNFIDVITCFSFKFMGHKTFTGTGKNSLPRRAPVWIWLSSFTCFFFEPITYSFSVERNNLSMLFSLILFALLQVHVTLLNELSGNVMDQFGAFPSHSHWCFVPILQNIWW